MSKLRALYAVSRDLKAEQNNPFNPPTRDESRRLSVKIVQVHNRILALLNPNRQ